MYLQKFPATKIQQPFKSNWSHLMSAASSHDVAQQGETLFQIKVLAGSGRNLCYACLQIS